VNLHGRFGHARDLRRELLVDPLELVGAQTSTAPAVTRAVQFIGSIVAWAR